jgi:hypothetical protein
MITRRTSTEVLRSVVEGRELLPPTLGKRGIEQTDQQQFMFKHGSIQDEER